MNDPYKEAVSVTCFPLRQRKLFLVQTPVFKSEASGLGGDVTGSVFWRPASIFAIRLLALLVQDSHPTTISYWAQVHAEEIKDAVTTTLNLAEVQQPGQLNAISPEHNFFIQDHYLLL